MQVQVVIILIGCMIYEYKELKRFAGLNALTGLAVVSSVVNCRAITAVGMYCIYARTSIQAWRTGTVIDSCNSMDLIVICVIVINS